MKELIVTIDENGKPTMEVKGVKGKACLDLTKDLEAALGGKVEVRKATAEMAQPQATVQTQQQRQGG